MWIVENKDKTVCLTTTNRELMAQTLGLDIKQVYTGKKIKGWTIRFESDYLYMLVTNDMYEHPVYVSDNLEEFCETTKLNKNTVLSQIKYNFKSLNTDKKYKVIRIQK